MTHGTALVQNLGLYSALLGLCLGIFGMWQSGKAMQRYPSGTDRPDGVVVAPRLMLWLWFVVATSSLLALGVKLHEMRVF